MGVILVLPLDESLISSFSNFKMILKVSDEEEITSGHRMISMQNHLEGVWVQPQRVMSETLINTEPGPTPIVWQISELGDLKTVLDSCDMLKIHPYLYLFKVTASNCTSVQILSSLGIRAGLDFHAMDPKPDWDKITDLAVYSAYSQAKHAPIEPFHTILKRYQIDNYTFFEDIYCSNPQKCIHLDKNGNAAFTNADLVKGNFCDVSLDSIAEVAASIEARKVKEAYRSHLLEFDHCSTCEAFRVCKGWFSDMDDSRQGCRMLFLELMEAAEQKSRAKVIR